MEPDQGVGGGKRQGAVGKARGYGAANVAPVQRDHAAIEAFFADGMDGAPGQACHGLGFKRAEVALRDPVSKYLPADVRVPQRGPRPVTLEDLATNRSPVNTIRSRTREPKYVPRPNRNTRVRIVAAIVAVRKSVRTNGTVGTRAAMTGATPWVTALIRPRSGTRPGAQHSVP